jgi:hypothetical protein
VTTSRSRVLNIIALVEAMRERYPVLRARVRARDIRRVLVDYGVTVHRAPIIDVAYVLGLPGAHAIVLREDVDPRHSMRLVLHELAHVICHLQGEDGLERHLHPCSAGDPREAEAELFARMLYYGPDAGPDNNKPIAEAIAAIEGARHLARMPEQLPLSLPEGAAERYNQRQEPTPREKGNPYPLPHPADRVPDWNDWKLPIEVRRKKWLEHIARQPKRGKAISHEEMLYDWSMEGKPLKYFHLVYGWIEVWDGMRVGRRWEILKVGDKRTQRRTFVISRDDRRRYDFREGAKRGYSVDEIDRQIARSKPFNNEREHAAQPRHVRDRR